MSSPISEGPTSDVIPGRPADGPSVQDGSQYKKVSKTRKTIQIVAFVGVGMILCIVVVLVAMLLIRCGKESKIKRTVKRPKVGPYKGCKEKPKGNDSLIRHTIEMKKGEYVLVQYVERFLFI